MQIYVKESGFANLFVTGKTVGDAHKGLFIVDDVIVNVAPFVLIEFSEVLNEVFDVPKVVVDL